MRTTAFLLFLSTLLCACAGGTASDGPGNGSDDRAAVHGRVIDSSGAAIAGAEVWLAGAATPLHTDLQGRFTVRTEAGDFEVRVIAAGVTLCQQVFTCSDGEELDLGQLALLIPYFVSGALWYEDADDDGFSSGSILSGSAQPQGYVLPAALQALDGDCDDSLDQVNPAAEEVCGDGLDNDCIGGDLPCVVNVAPVVRIAPLSPPFFVGEPVSLSSVGSDADDDPLTYEWSVTLAPNGSTAAVADPAASSTTVVPDLVGLYEFTCVLSDGMAESLPARVSVTVTPAPHRDLDDISVLDLSLYSGAEYAAGSNQSSIFARVLDQDGNSLEGLNSFNFSLTLRPTTRPHTLDSSVIELSTVVSPQSNVALLMDSSGSMSAVTETGEDRMTVAKAAAKMFVDLAAAEDQIAVVDFDDGGRTLQGLTNRAELLYAAIDTLSADGATSLGAALSEASRSVGPRPGKRAAILLTDGDDTVDSVSGGPEVWLHHASSSRAEGLAAAKASELAVFTVGLGDGLSDMGLADLQTIAAETGGAFFSAPTASDLFAAFSVTIPEIVNSLQPIETYQLTYEHPDPPQAGEQEVVPYRLRVSYENGLGLHGDEDSGDYLVQHPTTSSIRVVSVTDGDGSTAPILYAVEETDDSGPDGEPGTGDPGENDGFPDTGETLLAPLSSDLGRLVLENVAVGGVGTGTDLQVEQISVSYYDADGTAPLFAPPYQQFVAVTVPNGQLADLEFTLVPLAMKIDAGALRDIFLFGSSADRAATSVLSAVIDVHARNPVNGDVVHAQGTVLLQFVNPLVTAPSP